MDRFEGRLGLIQLLLANYRKHLYEVMAQSCDGGLSVFAARPPAKAAMAEAPDFVDVDYVQSHNVYLFGKSLLLCWQRGLLRWLNHWQPDALIVDTNPRILSNRLAVRWMHRRGRPALAWGLGVMPLSPGLHQLRAIGRAKYLRSFDGIIAYGSRAANDYEKLGIAKDRVFVAHNATARRPTTLPPSRPDGFHKRPRVLFVGRLIEGKRIDNLFHAAAALPESIQPSIDIVGDGPSRPQFEAVAREIYPRARFAGARFGDELGAFFHRADLFVLPGLGGLAVQEAMAHGLPVVVADADGTQDDLVGKENGWHSPSNDIDRLRQILAEALSDAPRLRRMGQASFRIVAEQINVEAMAQSMVDAVCVVSDRRTR